jgi:tetratricopeptide (TPR) repeat protein
MTLKACGRCLLQVFYLVVCVGGAVFCFRDGASRYNSKLALDNGDPDYAGRAVKLSHSDPLAYYSRGKVLGDAGDIAGGVEDLARAAALRPADHFLWLELGYLQSKTEDLQGALVSLRRAVALAPHYAQPRWYLGHTLLRVNQPDEGFRELRRAAAADPELYAGLLDLAAQVYGDNMPEIERVADPRSLKERLVLAQAFIKRGEVERGVGIVKAEGLTDADRLPLVEELLAAKRFYEAHEVWVLGRGRPDGRAGPFGLITNGEFESDRLDESGFNWKLIQKQNAVDVTLDGVEPRGGAKSCRIVFKGKSDPDMAIISQIVLVEPATRYKLVFSTRAKEIVTGGLPLVLVTDLNSSEPRELCRGEQVSGGTSGWREHELSFVTPEGTKAIAVSLRRQRCRRSPCPIFGELWLDNMSMRRA